MNRIVIVGGGIADLSAAYYATKKFPGAQITLIESSDCRGGKITIDRVSFDNGQFIIEGGPDTFLASKPYATALCRELGIGDRLHGTNPKQKNTYVLSSLKRLISSVEYSIIHSPIGRVPVKKAKDKGPSWRLS